MIASAQTLRKLQPLKPFVEKSLRNGMSYGLSAAGYDIRVDEKEWDFYGINPQGFMLVSSFEEFSMPLNLLGVVHDKSTWARLGLAVQNTVIEPGWKGFLTLELTNHSSKFLTIPNGSPIAQVIFYLLDEPTDTPYTGKYQDQPARPVEAIIE